MSSNTMFQHSWDDEETPTHTDNQPQLHPGRDPITIPTPTPTDDRKETTAIPPTENNDTPTALTLESAQHNTHPAGVDNQSDNQSDNPADNQPEHPRPPQYQTRQTLNHDSLTKHRADIPQHGWRRALYTATAGLINPGIGDTEKARQQLRERVRRRLHAPHRVAVLSVKGGIGKTTLTACIGFSMAETRGDQIAVIDANPDAGTFADRLTGDSSVNIRHLLHDLDKLDALTDVTSYMSLAGRLKVLASDQDPATSEALTAHEYRRATQLLSKYFNLVFTDCGTGISHATMTPTLEMAHSVIVIGSPTIDGASRAGHTLDWLNNHGYTTHAANAIIVLNHKDTSPDVDTTRITEHFTTRTGSVTRTVVPAMLSVVLGARPAVTESIRNAAEDAPKTLSHTRGRRDHKPDRQLRKRPRLHGRTLARDLLRHAHTNIRRTTIFHRN